MEPGAGTEVFGEESDLARMLHLLVGQTPTESADSASPEVHIRRQEDWVRVSVALGPDTSATADLERRGLSRMAVRHGGRLELEGGMQAVLLPADGASDQREVVELRKELEQAQQLGEAYARELAAVFAAGEHPSEPEAPPTPASDRFDILIASATAYGRLMRPWLEGLRADAARAAAELGETSGVAQSLGKRVSAGYELLGELRRVADCPRSEPARRVNVGELASQAVAGAGARAARHGVDVSVEGGTKLAIETRPGALELLLRALLDHAILATPREGSVSLRLEAADGQLVATVSDGGPTVPEGARADLLAYRVDPASFGRPVGPALLVAATVAAHLGGTLVVRQGGQRIEAVAKLPGA